MKKFTDTSRSKYDWVWRIEKTWEMFQDQREGEQHSLEVISGSLDTFTMTGEVPLELVTDFIDATIAAELEILNRTMTALRDALNVLLNHEISWSELYQNHRPSIEVDNRSGLKITIPDTSEGTHMYPSEGTVSAVRVGALYPELVVSAQLDIVHRDTPNKGFVIPHLFDDMFEIDVR